MNKFLPIIESALIDISCLRKNNSTHSTDSLKSHITFDSNKASTQSNPPQESPAPLPAKTFVQENNVYVVFEDGKQKQLTYNQSDADAFLLPDNKQVVYVRTDYARGSQTKKIMKVDVHTLKESVLSDQKPYRDALSESSSILSVNYPDISLDGQSLLFVTEKSMTESELVKVNLTTGKWTELFPAEQFEEIETGPYKGHFLIAQSAAEDRGRALYYRLVSSTGEIIKKFRDLESMKAFRNSMR